ncbi:MAG: Hsp20/alpha crystallin family protein [Candidatus Pacebacteria bacterium]|nr:Hsp20/alpha crystallin family protein [Candidatus Paceibacterota bacterium]
MAPNKKRSFFERLTGSIRLEEENEEVEVEENAKKPMHAWIEEENDEAELAVDVYQTPRDIIIQTMIAGVKPDDVDLTIARDVIVIKGKRDYDHNIDDENYFTKELYWGKFSRTISLPQEVEPELVEATEKHGLLTIKIQKVDKDKKNVIKVKSI